MKIVIANNYSHFRMYCRRENISPYDCIYIPANNAPLARERLRDIEFEADQVVELVQPIEQVADEIRAGIKR